VSNPVRKVTINRTKGALSGDANKRRQLELYRNSRKNLYRELLNAAKQREMPFASIGKIFGVSRQCIQIHWNNLTSGKDLSFEVSQSRLDYAENHIDEIVAKAETSFERDFFLFVADRLKREEAVQAS